MSSLPVETLIERTRGILRSNPAQAKTRKCQKQGDFFIVWQSTAANETKCVIRQKDIGSNIFSLNHNVHGADLYS
ncbi:hypothetical protein KV580_30860 [Pseudomonas chlororaphis]|nr:hypothetical protein [Pseudomonas chlororaphis]